MGVAAYPWAALARISWREREASTALRESFVAAGVTPRTLSDALHALVGHATKIDPRRRAVVPLSRVDLGARGTTIVLEGDGRVVALEVEAELALAVVGALSGGRALPKIAKERKVGAEIAGALAGVVLHLGRACGANALVVTSIDASTGDVRARLGAPAGVDEVLVVDARVEIGALRSMVRIAASAPPTARIETARLPSKQVLAEMGDTPLSASIVLGAGVARYRDVVLRLGDVLVVDDLSRTRCALIPVGATHGVEAELVDATHARLGKVRAELAAEPPPDEDDDARASKSTPAQRAPLGKDEVNVTDTTGSTGETMEMNMDEDSPLADALADAPIVVRVEAGSVTLPARAWAAMGAGDVVALDRRVGDSVLVRIGGRLVARGELVDVDGTLGVRILERLP